MGQIEIRLCGTPEDIEALSSLLDGLAHFLATGEIGEALRRRQAGGFSVLSHSRHYRDRGGSAWKRCYLKAEIRARPEAWAGPARGKPDEK